VHRLHRVAAAHGAAPTIDELILDLISLDYHETLLVPSGKLKPRSAATRGRWTRTAAQVRARRRGSDPDEGRRHLLQDRRPDRDRDGQGVRRGKAGAIIAIGSCASWGGVPSADPNPTGASGAHEILKGKTVVSIPGCPANPYNLLGTVLQYATLGTLPELDELNRPKFAYGQTIHEHCPRRAHFDAGRFALEYGDPGHRQGWCLYRLGCKGPATHANCSVNHFNEVVGAWPIGLGHPCFGCTEQKLAFRVPLHDTVPIDRPTPPDTYPPIHAPQGGVSPVATGIAGLVGGAVVGAAWMAAKKLGDDEPKPQN
jgi:hydrogenase small subunit